MIQRRISKTIMKDYICKVCGFNNYPDRFWKDTMPELITDKK